MTVLGEAFVAVRPETSGFGEELGSKLSGLGGTIPVIGGITAAAVGAGAALFAIGEKFQDAFHTIQQQTGATGPALDKLEGSFKTVLSTAVGANFSNVTAALSEVSIRSGLTGKALDALTTQFVELGKMDPSANIKDLTAVMGLFNVKAADQSKTLDVLFKAHQAAGVSVGQLTADMQAAAPQAQALGLNADQTAAIITNLDKVGLPAAKTMAGLGAEFAKAAKAGKDPTRVIADMLTQIKQAPSASAAARIAVADFGIGARQAATLVTAARNGAFDFNATLQAISSSGGGINATAQATASLGEKFAMLKNKVLVALEPIAMKVVDLADKLFDDLGPAFEKVEAVVVPVLQTIKGYWNDFMNGFSTGNTSAASGLKGIIGLFNDLGVDVRQVIGIVTRAWDAFTQGFSGKGTEGLAGWEKTFAKFGDTVRPIIEWIGKNAKPILIGLGVAFLAVTSPVTLLVGGLVYLYNKFEAAREIIQTVAGLIKDVLILAFRQAAAYIQLVVGVFGDLIAFIEDIFEGKWGKAFDALMDIPAKFAKFLQETFHNIIGLFTGLPNQIINVLGGLVSSVVGFFAHLPGQIGNALAALPGVLIHVGASAIGSLISGLASALPTIGQWFLKLPFYVLGLLIGADVWLIKTGLNVVAGLVSGFIQAIPSIASWFVSLPGKILGFMVTANVWLIRKGLDVIAGLITGFVQAIPGIVSWFKNLPSGILNAIGDAGQWLVNTGWNIIKGLVNGLKNGAANLVTDVVHGIAHSISKGFSDVLGIFSPSTVFASHGQDIMRGLANGILSQANAPVAAIQAVAQKVNAAFSALNTAVSNHGVFNGLVNMVNTAAPTNHGVFSGLANIVNTKNAYNAIANQIAATQSALSDFTSANLTSGAGFGGLLDTSAFGGGSGGSGGGGGGGGGGSSGSGGGPLGGSSASTDSIIALLTQTRDITDREAVAQISLLTQIRNFLQQDVTLAGAIRDYLAVMNSNAPLSHVEVHAAPGMSAAAVGVAAAQQAAWNLRTTVQPRTP